MPRNQLKQTHLTDTATITMRCKPPPKSVLRHDIQRLADYGVIKGPTSTWPLAWGPLMADITSYNYPGQLPRDITDAISRVSANANWEMREGQITYNASASIAENPTRIRSFPILPGH